MVKDNKKTKEKPKKERITARQRAWNSMRIFRTFKDGDIEATAEIGLSNLRSFISLLLACGYLCEIGKTSETGDRRNPRIAVYTLLNDSGPRTPQQAKPTAEERKKNPLRLKGLFDQNTGETIWENGEITNPATKKADKELSATARQRAWSIMRDLETFTAKDIEEAAQIGFSNLREFISLLLLCGFLGTTEDSKDTGYRRNTQLEKYILLIDSGPRTPKQVHPTAAEKRQNPLRLRGLRDQNTGKTIWPERRPTVKELQNGMVRPA